ncbi:SSI family serine proteinase inhibitor [Kitasatospora sp. NPDC085879]|uniref:SSI family serine proteinase inhibitor n=1 Tax=Kitasatospora sp. NPDC085879 TaxID=3154769 RepID=UPI00341C98B9
MLRRLAVITAIAALFTGSTGVPAVADTEDRLTVTVAGYLGADGTYLLECHPARGSHPRPLQACDRLDAATTWGQDPFAPAPTGEMCSMISGGPATAHITGFWAGRPVNATYDRSNGCEISRWDNLVPVLPSVR